MEVRYIVSCKRCDHEETYLHEEEVSDRIACIACKSSKTEIRVVWVCCDKEVGSFKNDFCWTCHAKAPSSLNQLNWI